MCGIVRSVDAVLTIQRQGRLKKHRVHEPHVPTPFIHRNGGRHPNAYPRRRFRHQNGQPSSQVMSAVSGESISNTRTSRPDFVLRLPW